MTSTVKVNTLTVATGCTMTLGESGKTIALASGASQTGFGRTGTVDWVTTVQTSTPFTAATGKGYFVNTTSGAITANLPAGAAGSIVSFADYAGTWDSNALTVSPNGSEKMGGVAADVILNTEGQSVTFVYIDSTQGWLNVQDSTSNVRGNDFIVATGGTITTTGDYKMHKFTGPGTFCVSEVSAGCAANNVVSYIVVAGGAGGGSTASGSFASGGGGAGGFREVKSPTAGPYTASPLDGYPSAPNRITVTATGYPITVGGGGAAGPVPSGTGTGVAGVNSTFSTITSAGGGGGGAGASPGSNGVDGGSGGGAGSNSSTPRSGGSGNTPPVSPAQGNDGGDSGGGDTPAASGGGATGAGVNATPGSGNPRTGGTGATTEIIASPVTYSTGGASGNHPQGTGTAGGDNTGTGGQGGGGGSPSPGAAGAGGSGIVIIRYKYK